MNMALKTTKWKSSLDTYYDRRDWTMLLPQQHEFHSDRKTCFHQNSIKAEWNLGDNNFINKK